MATLGVMIEAQEGLDWDRWRRIVHDCERLGFATLRCSDHCLSVVGVEGRKSLQTWIALALGAEWSERIQLGPMVSPITFYQPAVLARMAVAVDELSGGRLILGLGAGWNQLEHEAFGIPFPSVGERFDMLEAGISRIHSIIDKRQIPLLIGGGGERRTLDLVARGAEEWNLLGADADAYRAKAALLDEKCRAISRDPAEIRRSVMGAHLIGRNETELETRAAALRELIPGLAGGGSPADTVATLRRRRGRWFVGTPGEIVDILRPYVSSGVDLFMLQHYLLDDGEALELLASEVMPALA